MSITARSYEPRPVIRELEFMNSTDVFFHAAKAWATKKGGLRDQLKIFEAFSHTEPLKAWATRNLNSLVNIETWIDSYETHFIKDYVIDIQKTGWSDDYCEYAINAACNISRQITTVNQWLATVNSDTTRIQHTASLKNDPHPADVNKLYIEWAKTALCEIKHFGTLIDAHCDEITVFQTSS